MLCVACFSPPGHPDKWTGTKIYFLHDSFRNYAGFLLVSSQNPTFKNLHCSLANLMRTKHSISKTLIMLTAIQLLKLFCVVFYSPYLLKSNLSQCSSTFCASPSLRDNSCTPSCSKHGSGLLQTNIPKSCAPLPGDALTG